MTVRDQANRTAMRLDHTDSITEADTEIKYPGQGKPFRTEDNSEDGSRKSWLGCSVQVRETISGCSQERGRLSSEAGTEIKTERQSRDRDRQSKTKNAKENNRKENKSLSLHESKIFLSNPARFQVSMKLQSVSKKTCQCIFKL